MEARPDRRETNVRSSGRTNASSRKLPQDETVVQPSQAIIVLVYSCAHECDAKLTDCTAATPAYTCSRPSGQWRRARTGVIPTCGRAVAPTSSRKLPQGEAVVR